MEESSKDVEHWAIQAMTSHGVAAYHHSKINDERHKRASEAHTLERNRFVTRLKDHRRQVKHYYPPNDNRGAFDWHVANEQRIKDYRKSSRHGNYVKDGLVSAQLALDSGNPTLANRGRNVALGYQPARLACGVDPFINGGNKFDL